MTKARDLASNASGAAPTIIDAKGDLVVGTAADAAARVAVGTANQTILADSSQTAGVKWAASPTSVLGTTGDILYASGANTLAALAAGTSGYALTANGAGVAPSYQAIPTGSMTQLATGTLSGTSTSITGISSAYQDLRLLIKGAYDVNSNTGTIRVNSDTGSVWEFNSFNSGTSTLGQTNNAAGIIMGVVGNSVANSNEHVIYFPDYANTTTFKNVTCWFMGSNSTPTYRSSLYTGGYRGSTSAISSIQIYNSSGGSWSGGTYVLYGVK